MQISTTYRIQHQNVYPFVLEENQTYRFCAHGFQNAENRAVREEILYHITDSVSRSPRSPEAYIISKLKGLVQMRDNRIIYRENRWVSGNWTGWSGSADIRKSRRKTGGVILRKRGKLAYVREILKTYPEIMKKPEAERTVKEQRRLDIVNQALDTVHHRQQQCAPKNH